MKIITEILFLMVLYILAVVDFRRQIVPDWGPALIAVLALVRLAAGILTPAASATGLMLLGGTVFLLAVLTGGIGGGDVKLLGTCGAFLGLLPGADFFLLSFFLSGVFAAGLKILPVFIEKPTLSRIREIPIVPFAALAATLIFLQNRL